MSDAPVVLVLSSDHCDPKIIAPIVAAMEANGSSLQVLVAGREEEGAVSWVLRTLSGESDHSKLAEEIAAARPDVAVCFDPKTAVLAEALRKDAARSFPLVAVLPDLDPSSEWAQSNAERFLVVDDESAASLEELGIPGHSIVTVGGMGAFAFAFAGRQDKSVLKKRFGISGRVALVLVEGLGHEASAQLALQLSLVKTPLTYLFDAGTDSQAAAALRSQVPELGMKAKLFGDSDDAPLYWRCSDVIVAAPTTEVVHRSKALALPLLCLLPTSGQQAKYAQVIEERGQGAVCSTISDVGDALVIALGRGKGRTKAGEDGANTIADAVFLIGRDRQEVLAERNDAARKGRREQVSDAEEYTSWVDRSATPAVGLEDLGGDNSSGPGRSSPKPARPSIPKLQRLLDEIKVRKKRLAKTIADAQKESGNWDKERAKAEKLGSKNMAMRSERNGDMERARMHSALSEMAELAEEEQSLERAIEAAEADPTPIPQPPSRTVSASPDPSPPEAGRGRGRSTSPRPSIDEELARMREKASDSPPPKKKKRRSKKRKSKSDGGVDDALAALKRKMQQRRKK